MLWFYVECELRGFSQLCVCVVGRDREREQSADSRLMYGTGRGVFIMNSLVKLSL